VRKRYAQVSPLVFYGEGIVGELGGFWEVESGALHLVWLDRISQAAGKKIYCAADFMSRPCRLLEARRTELYRNISVEENWHENYEKGRITIDIDP